MIIPKLHYIVQGDSPKKYLENIQKSCSSGIELVQLGVTNISEKKLLKIAKEAREITSHFQTRLVICDHYKIAKEIKADGVYFNQISSFPISIRKHLFTWQSIGASANTIQDCNQLLDKGVDYICLGPYRNINTKDTILGLKGYTAIVDALKTNTPIIGFGDITKQDVLNILETGISGIALSKEITSDFNTIRIFNQLLKASSTEEKRYTFE